MTARDEVGGDPPLPGEARCGATTIGGTGIEWICCRPPHPTMEVELDRAGNPLPVQDGDRHWYVRRRSYPWGL